jgi:hypothetical protein
MQLGRPGRYLTVLEMFRVSSAGFGFLTLLPDGGKYLQLCQC